MKDPFLNYTDFAELICENLCNLLILKSRDSVNQYVVRTGEAEVGSNLIRDLNLSFGSGHSLASDHYKASHLSATDSCPSLTLRPFLATEMC